MHLTHKDVPKRSETGENAAYIDDDGETKSDTRAIQLHMKEIAPPESDTGESEPHIAPDGGWGWAVCFACFMTHVLIDGMLYSFGVIFVELLDYFGGTKGETAWVGSLAPATMFIIGPIVGALTNRFGCRVISIIGAFVISGGYIISIFAPNLYFLYFSLGIVTGIGFGLVYLPSIVCVSQYFEKHRALATGLGVCGSGIGTFIYSPLTKYLIDWYDWKGAILIQGGLVLNCIACGAIYRPLSDNRKQRSGDGNSPGKKSETTSSAGCVNNAMEETFRPISRSIMSMPSNMAYHQDTTVNDTSLRISKSLPIIAEKTLNRVISVRLYPTVSRARFFVRQESYIPDADSQDKHAAVLREILISLKEAFGLYRNTAFLMFVVSIFFYGLGYYVTYVYLPDKAKGSGIDDYRAAMLVASVGITSTVGRVVFGYISDRKCVNRMYLYATALVICGISTSLAALAVTFETLLVYSVVFGLFSGVTISLVAVITTDLVGIDRLADGFGLANMFGGVAVLVGPPLAGWMFDATGSYNATFVASGVTITISGFLVYFIPCIDNKKKVNDWE